MSAIISTYVPYVHNKHKNSLVSSASYVSPPADVACVSLCSQVLELMLAAVQCNQDCSLTTITVVFRDLHKHWESFVSKLKCDPKKGYIEFVESGEESVGEEGEGG